MIENQGLSYGLFHAIAQPLYSWGVIRKVTFPGVNMDIGHVRPIGYSKDNDKNTWIAYNKLRGQYMSALEHAIPERFFNDPSKCNPEGATTPVTGLPLCPQGISAVKAIAIAAQAGQKIYTINQEVYQANPNIVSTALSAHSQSTRQAVQDALDSGHEVTIHEAPITQSGWTGAGYTTIDPSTGAGGYMIEGGSNGGFLDWGALGSALRVAFIHLLVYASFLPLFLILAVLAGPLIALALAIVVFWSLVLVEIQTLDQGFARSTIANLAWGAFGIALGALTGSLVVALVAWILGAIGNTLISSSERYLEEGMSRYA